ncbi:hypothetical protein [Aquibacillus albus]|uniref:Membrane protein n=1 Tax=Aquibacillus albus TaxID=1168171 RepID=A0ABS2N4E8_9BACI|nr:hypothetical protein [Aquibacillus albus]MBM7573020.1 putative membrane protein [Aquibacillus albus]
MFYLVGFFVITVTVRLLGLFGWAYLDNWVIATKFGVSFSLLVMAIAHINLVSSDLNHQVHPAYQNIAILIMIVGWIELILSIALVIPSMTNAASMLIILLFLFGMPARAYVIGKGYFF